MASKRRILLAPMFLGCLALPAVVFFLVRPPRASYGFVRPDHPIDMWQNGRDRWAYYGLGFGTMDRDLAAAREELAALGFQEDKSRRPWFRFTRGDQEVVLCYHHEFSIQSDVPVIPKTTPAFQPVKTDYVAILVKNGPGTDESIPLFQIKKVLRGW